MGQSKYYAEFKYGTGADRHTYQIYKDKLTYGAAKAYATSLTGDQTKSYLVSPGSSAENDAVYNKTTEFITPGPDANYVWTGGNYEDPNWKYYYNGSTIDDGGGNYTNWNQLAYDTWFLTQDATQKYMAMGLQYDAVTGKEWYPKQDTSYHYVVETVNGYEKQYKDINTIGYGRSKDIISDYSTSAYKDGVRINASELTNFDHYTDWTFKAARNKKKLKKFAKRDLDFVYYQKKGDLYYNENGSSKGWGSGGAFARFDDEPRLTSDQLSVYAYLGEVV